MRTNVFLRSTRRQPVRTVFLLLVTALVTFTFVGRASEYLLIRKEVDRLGSYYRSVGILAPKTREARENTYEAAAYLRSAAGIQTLNQYRYTSALIQDGFCNGDDKPQSPTTAATCISTVQ